MELKTKLERGVLSVDLGALVEAMDAETKKEIAKLVAADEQVIKAAVELAASPDRWGHYFTDDEDGSWHLPLRAVREIREKLLPAMPEIARQLVAELIRERDEAQREAQGFKDWAWRLYHAWPNGYWSRRPDRPEWVPPPDDHEAKVEAEVAARLPTEAKP